MKYENSKVFEQKGSLLSFKVNIIDPKSGLILSCAEPSQAKSSFIIHFSIS